ncbi:Uma2 family endonuclease [Synechococcus sp. PCC 6312]|uniref:Uma2 family endonuclease n=1 Tax=Synechococcus sp. (strain ATCC 27167 / PCC 6312) TaxID=195253 RepID=UPI00029F3FF2|nr:Uma2 family endonuclease [Synechococcus sp. PCC 6312]AFY60811.1 hypothetical protein Syn6312_1652 [Synechococcus sp. PCC 6312]
MTLAEALSPTAKPTQPMSDTWLPVAWDEYQALVTDPANDKTKCYYYRGHMRLEMPPVSHDHAESDGTITLAVNLFGIAQGIRFKVLGNCSYRKSGVAECQPDVSFYLGDKTQAVPFGTGVIDLETYPAPDLVIEVAKSSLFDDLSVKRFLYESLGVKEYWVVDVEKIEITAYVMTDGGSNRIQGSQVLPGLAFTVLEEALRRSRETDQSQVGAWLLSQFQSG